MPITLIVAADNFLTRHHVFMRNKFCCLALQRPPMPRIGVGGRFAAILPPIDPLQQFPFRSGSSAVTWRLRPTRQRPVRLRWLWLTCISAFRSSRSTSTAAFDDARHWVGDENPEALFGRCMLLLMISMFCQRVSMRLAILPVPRRRDGEAEHLGGRQVRLCRERDGESECGFAEHGSLLLLRNNRPAQSSPQERRTRKAAS
jgi:hypothetical protein